MEIAARLRNSMGKMISMPSPTNTILLCNLNAKVFVLLVVDCWFNRQYVEWYAHQQHHLHQLLVLPQIHHQTSLKQTIISLQQIRLILSKQMAHISILSPTNTYPSFMHTQQQLHQSSLLSTLIKKQRDCLFIKIFQLSLDHKVPHW